MNDTIPTSHVLNESLYSTLIARFGAVKIYNQGMPMVYTASDVQDQKTGRMVRQMYVQQWGEAYRVCCPKCRDRRFRLVINHKHRTFDPVANKTFGACVTCFNESCDHSDFDDLYLKMYMYEGKGVEVISPVSTEPMMLMMADPPGTVAALSTLESNHPAIKYLRSRKGGGFEPIDLERNYNVCFCYESEAYPTMKNRLVIPIYRDNVLVGWQGRALYDDIKPKYYTMPGFQKAQTVFNFDKARYKPIVVICEGVFDAIRVGDCGVCLFGHKPSMQQKKLLAWVWRHGAAAVMLDSDDEDAQAVARDWVDEWRKQKEFENGVANIVLPNKLDPSDMTTDELWREIYRQCNEQEVKVTL